MNYFSFDGKNFQEDAQNEVTKNNIMESEGASSSCIGHIPWATIINMHALACFYYINFVVTDRLVVNLYHFMNHEQHMC